MKRIFLAILFLAVGASQVTAQASKEPRPQVASTRVAVVNIGYVFRGYSKCTESAGSWKGMEALEPYKLPARKLADELTALEIAVQDRNFANHSEAELKAQIAKIKKRLEDANDKLKAAMGKMQEEKLERLWKDIQGTVKSYAIEHKIDVVLAFGDHVEKELLDQFPNVNRKMQAMDFGGTVPLFAMRHTDISEDIVRQLNTGKPAQDIEKPARVPPPGTERVAVVNIGAVVDQYEKAQHFKKELEKSLAPYKAKAKELNPEGKQAFANEITKVLEKKQEANLMVIWKDLQAAIKAHVAEHDVELVLGYGAPPPEIAAMFSVNRKLQEVDRGGAVPLVTSSGADISQSIVERLNKKYQEKNK